MLDTESNPKLLAVFGLAVMLLLAGCFQPPGPPKDTPTPTAEPQPYADSGDDLVFPEMQPEHQTSLEEQEGYFTRYRVNVSDPRFEENKSFERRYRVNLRTNESLMVSTFEEGDAGKYQDTLLLYEQENGQTTVTRLAEANESRYVSRDEAAGNLSVVRNGMNAADYSLKSVRYTQGGHTLATYTATSEVSNFDVSALLPDNLSYEFGEPQVANEEIKSTIIIRDDGRIKSYKFTYTANIFIGGNKRDYELTITYQTLQTTPNLPVPRPDWASQDNSSATGS